MYQQINFIKDMKEMGAKMPKYVQHNIWMFPPTALPHLCSSPCQRYLTGPIHSIPCRYCGSMSLWMDHQVNNYFFHLPTYLLFFSLGLSINVVYFVFQKTCSLWPFFTHYSIIRSVKSIVDQCHYGWTTSLIITF